MMNNRLELDRKLASPKHEKKSIPMKLVQNTWKQHTLKDEKQLPENWVTNDGIVESTRCIGYRVLGTEKRRLKNK
jgi:hypothetical protein